MREYNFKASDSTGEMLMGLGFSFSFLGVAGIILTLRLILFPKIKYSSYVDNIYLEKFLIIVPALIITACLMKAIKNVKFNKKGNKISKCYKLIIKTNSKDLKFFVRTKENYFGGATENDFDNLENFYLFLKEKISK